MVLVQTGPMTRAIDGQLGSEACLSQERSWVISELRSTRKYDIDGFKKQCMEALRSFNVLFETITLRTCVPFPKCARIGAFNEVIGLKRLTEEEYDKYVDNRRNYKAAAKGGVECMMDGAGGAKGIILLEDGKGQYHSLRFEKACSRAGELSPCVIRRGDVWEINWVLMCMTQRW